MKTQKFSEQRLEELVEKGETTTTEPVKKGEKLYDWCEPVEVCRIDEKTGAELLFKVGEVRQAVNEKREKIFYCNDCKEMANEKHLKKDPYSGCPTCGIDKPNPLLVRLKKIEEQTYDKTKKFRFKTWVKT